MRFYGVSLHPGHDRMYIVTELMAGTIEQALTVVPSPLLDPETVRSLAEQISMGMAHLHSMGVVHYDLKPANILCDKTFTQVKIADFSSSTIAGASQGGRNRRGMGSAQPASHCRGTAEFMAPELITLSQNAEYEFDSGPYPVGGTEGGLSQPIPAKEAGPKMTGVRHLMGKSMQKMQGYLDRVGKVLPAYRKPKGTTLKASLKNKLPEDLSKFLSTNQPNVHYSQNSSFSLSLSLSLKWITFLLIICVRAR